MAKKKQRRAPKKKPSDEMKIADVGDLTEKQIQELLKQGRKGRPPGLPDTTRYGWRKA